MLISFLKKGYNFIKKYALFYYNNKLGIYKNYGYGVHISKPYCIISNRNHIAIGAATTIGKFARIQPILKYANKTFSPLIEIGSNVCINQNFHCTCAKLVRIGDGTSITANCGIFDIIHPYEDINVNPRYADIIVCPIEIGQNCLIGMNSVILPGTILGRHCVVGANTVVKGKFPDYCVIVGSPARIVKRYNPTTEKWEKTNPDGSFIEK